LPHERNLDEIFYFLRRAKVSGGVNEARYESEAITGSSDGRQIPESEQKGETQDP
jgi:hypothetical protein